MDIQEDSDLDSLIKYLNSNEILICNLYTCSREWLITMSGWINLW